MHFGCYTIVLGIFVKENIGKDWNIMVIYCSTCVEINKCSTIRLFLLGFKTAGSESFYCVDMYIKL